MSILDKESEVPIKVVKKNAKSEKNPLVSVIITTLPGREKLLERAVNSVKRQTYDNIEIIIQSDKGDVQEERNKGVEKSKGVFIAFLDDDDEWNSSKIEAQVEYMKNNPKCSLVMTGAMNFRGRPHYLCPEPVLSFKRLIDGFHCSCTSTFFVRREDFYRVGGFTTGLLDAHEYDLAIKLSQIGSINTIQSNHAFFFSSGDNWGYNYKNKIRGMFQFINIWKHHFTLKRWIRTIGYLGLLSLQLFLPGAKHLFLFLQCSEHPCVKIFKGKIGG
jgi:glycosyltransferase involved in cell wall biosynthesis